MKSPTIHTYDKYHEVYDQETIDFWDNFPQSTIDKFVETLPGNSVLNVGSGPGRDALLLKKKGLTITCLDASKEMVQRTESLGFNTILADFRKMPFKYETFDGVWAYTSLLHISKREIDGVIKRIHRILKSNGVFMIGMIKGKSEGEIERESMPKAQRHFSFYESAELRKIITQHGFVFVFQENYTPHSKTYLNQIYQKR